MHILVFHEYPRTNLPGIFLGSSWDLPGIFLGSSYGLFPSSHEQCLNKQVTNYCTASYIVKFMFSKKATKIAKYSSSI